MVVPLVFLRPGSTVKMYFSVRVVLQSCIFLSRNPGQKPWSKTWPKIWSKIWPKIRARRPCIKNPTVQGKRKKYEELPGNMEIQGMLAQPNGFKEIGTS